MTSQPNIQTFEDQLHEHGSFMYRNVGASMRPLIKQGRDLVIIERKPKGRLGKYDVVLYKHDGRYILHRIIKVRRKDYVICGDNCIKKERGITDDDILGIMTGLVRKGKQISIEDAAYQRYAKAWCRLYPARVGLRKGHQLVSLVVHMIPGVHRAVRKVRDMRNDAREERD